MQENEKINKIVSFLVDNYDLESFELPSEYDYSCLPLCILDAVFSIGVKYKSVENVISRFCAKTGVLKYRDPSTEEYTVSAFCDYIDTTGIEAFENDILENHQRTSSKNGISKAEAVWQVAELLRKNRIDTKADFNTKMNSELEKQYKEIQGQSSGISLNYLKMLAGSDDLVKPDRHIMKFLTDEYGFEIFKPCQAQPIIDEVTKILKSEFSNISQRKVDYMIWNYMSAN